MSNIIDYLKGKKTYGVGLLGLTALFSYTMGYIEPDTFWTLASGLGFVGLMTMRDAIDQLRESIQKKR